VVQLRLENPAFQQILVRLDLLLDMYQYFVQVAECPQEYLADLNKREN
jgi:hypothetical protein